MPNLETFIYEGKSAIQSHLGAFYYSGQLEVEKKFPRLKSIFFEFETKVDKAYLDFLARSQQVINQYGYPRNIHEIRSRFEESTRSYFTSKFSNLQIEMHCKCSNRKDGDNIKGVDHFVIWSNTTFRSETSKECGF